MCCQAHVQCSVLSEYHSQLPELGESAQASREGACDLIVAEHTGGWGRGSSGVGGGDGWGRGGRDDGELEEQWRMETTLREDRGGEHSKVLAIKECWQAGGLFGDAEHNGQRHAAHTPWPGSFIASQALLCLSVWHARTSECTLTSC